MSKKLIFVIGFHKRFVYDKNIYVYLKAVSPCSKSTDVTSMAFVYTYSQ